VGHEYHRQRLLAGLVAITLPLLLGQPHRARFCWGAVAGVIVVYGVELLEYLRIDDPIGRSVTACVGIWGTWYWVCRYRQFGATGPFAADNSAPLKGLFYGGGTQVLVAQIVGNGIITTPLSWWR